MQSGELGVEHKLDDHWRVAVGARTDDRENIIPNASPILSENGQRTDVAVTVGYQPAPGKAAPVSGAQGPNKPAAAAPGAALPPWDIYGYVQDTVVHTETRPDNDRTGLGGSYQISDAARIGAEASDGGLGFGGKVCTDYHIDEHSNVYLNYTLAADQPDALNDGRAGTLTTGTRYRYSDSTSVFGEERMQNGSGSDSLTHAYGVDFSPPNSGPTASSLRTARSPIRSRAISRCNRWRRRCSIQRIVSSTAAPSNGGTMTLR